ncbi:MAG TPA: hypothetical protein VFG10_11085 [Saprospiraceae bacterium]|nr:hypothetical protein [Saprospiraceae bacterium]
MKLKFLTYPILILLVLLKCGASPLKNYHSLIQGNWSKDVYNAAVSNMGKRTIYCSFEDSLCAVVNWPLAPYTIHNDTLIIYSKRQSDLEHGYDQARYRIRQLDSDRMTLEHFGGWDWNPFHVDVVQLNRIKPIHNGTFDRMGFCYHKFPDGPEVETQYFELDSSGILYLDGLHHVGLNGLYSGTIQKQDLNYLSQYIRSIPLEELNLYYSIQATHQDSWRVLLKTSLGTYESGGYGYGNAPVALLMLYNKLKQLYVNADIKQDSSVINQFQFTEFYRNRNDLRNMQIGEPQPKVITRFIRKGIDETNLFNEFTFFFQPGGELIAIGNGVKHIGTFELIVNRNDKKQADLVYYFGFQNIEPLDRLDLEWRESPDAKGNSKYYHKNEGEEESVLELMRITE